MTKVLVTGGTGLIGRQVCKKLKETGFDVAILSRNIKNQAEFPTYYWNIELNEIDKEAVNSCDYIIHLAGADIGKKRWTIKRKKEIIESRIKSSELIFNNIDKNNKRLVTFISASAVGYYGTITSQTIFNETDISANDFLGKTCRKWELVTDKFIEMGIRTVKIRTGIVLSKQGGAFSKLILPIKLGIGSALGNGKQYMPWIHIDDLCNIYIKSIIDSKMNGVYNAVAPKHVTYKEFINETASSLGKSLWFPNIPAFIMKLIFGEMSVILLNGTRVSSNKIVSAGYKFLFPDLNAALKQLLFNNRNE